MGEDESMCYFIVVGIPASASKKWLSELPEGVALRPTHYHTIKSAVPGFTFDEAIKGNCSCDLYKHFNQPNKSNLRRKYHKKGWNEEKIRNVIQDYIETKARKSGIDKQLRDWVASIADREGEAFILVHWDSDDMPSFTEPKQITSSSLRDDSISVTHEQFIKIQRTEITKNPINNAGYGGAIG